eukprot:349250-Rhodomonas_salina.2
MECTAQSTAVHGMNGLRCWCSAVRGMHEDRAGWRKQDEARWKKMEKGERVGERASSRSTASLSGVRMAAQGRARARRERLCFLRTRKRTQPSPRPR